MNVYFLLPISRWCSAASWEAGIWYPSCCFRREKTEILNAPHLLSLIFYCHTWHHMVQNIPLGQPDPAVPPPASHPAPACQPSVGEWRNCLDAVPAQLSIVLNTAVSPTPLQLPKHSPALWGERHLHPSKTPCTTAFWNFTFLTYLLIRWIFITLPRYWNIALYQIKCPGDV